MIQIVESQTGYAPIIVCDHCGERIKDAELAGAVAPDSNRYPNGNRRVLHLHKGECLETVASSEHEKLTWEELSRHLRLLISNVGLTPQELIDQEKTDKEFGILTNK